MFRAKKGIELTFNVIIVAIICLIVLIIIIAIFSGQMGDISKGFTNIRERETDESVLEDVFGCSEGTRICRKDAGKDAVYVCTNGEFVKERECPNRCQAGSCV